MKKLIIIAVLSLITGHWLSAQQVNINGFARTYEGLLFENGDFSLVQQTLNLNFEKPGNKVAFKANPMLYLYESDSISFNMREIYLDLYFKKFDLRIGKQQVVWGKADGVFITDIVSPLNLNEFLLPDFDEIRMGVIGAKINYYLGNNTLEAILIPVFEPNELPKPGSIWYIQPDFPAPPVFDLSKEKIKPSLENSELFLKYTAMTSAIDFEIMGAYTWDDYPTMYTTKLIDTTSGQLTGLLVTPEYKRLTIGGGSFSSTVKSFVFRGEAAYYGGKYFQTTNPAIAGAVEQKEYLHYLAGIDLTLSNLKLSTQFIQKTILNYNDELVNDQTENTMTFLARYDMLRETLHLELFSYVGLNYGDALIRPKVTYDLEDSFSVLLGANIFTGDSRGNFGRYDDNSMVYTKIKYSF